MKLCPRETDAELALYTNTVEANLKATNLFMFADNPANNNILFKKYV